MDVSRFFIISLAIRKVTMNAGSKPFAIDATDVKKILKGALIAAAGGVIAYGASLLPGIDQSTAMGGIIATVGSVCLQAARKWLADNSK